MNDICIIGSGGFGREVRCLIEDINSDRRIWNIAGFINTDRDFDPQDIEGLPLLNMPDLLARSSKLNLVLGIGHPAIKAKVLRALPPDAVYPNLIHPSVIYSSRVNFDNSRGVVITAGNILTTNIKIDSFVMLNLACTVGHDVRIGEFAVISPGVNVSGCVTIGAGASVGTGAKIIEGISIGDWSIIGAGAVVNQNIPANSTAVGVPAKVIKTRQAGWQI